MTRIGKRTFIYALLVGVIGAEDLTPLPLQIGSAG
jgi:hypothetical protein